MKIIIANSFTTRSTSDCLIVPFWEEKKQPLIAAEIKKNLSLMQLPADVGDFSGKESEIVIIYPKGEKEKRILLLGLGKKKDISIESLRKTFGYAIKRCMAKRMKKVSVICPLCEKVSEEEAVLGVVEGFLSANYFFHKFTTGKEFSVPVDQVQLIGVKNKHKALIEKTKIISAGVNLARDLVNNNADEEIPKHLVDVAKSFTKLSEKLKLTIFDKKKMEEQKMGCILAVGKGASVEPYLIQLSYRGDPKSKDHSVLVGKGVTYDTGGLSLKPSTGMESMKADMSGAAAVLGTIYVICRLGLPINVTGMVPAVENAIGPNSYKPGDIYRSYLGKTVEVVNTDAEGRLILADALAYAAKNLNPTRIIDIASLTGAIVIALGEEVAGMFSNNDNLSSSLEKAADQSGENLWRMPLYKDYKGQLKSDIADLKNVGDRRASSITASLFLSEFIQNVPWAHIDIGGTNFVKEAKKYHPKLATGYGVRLFVQFLESLLTEKKS
jgi:leucyl aminopeptidase